MDFDSAYIESMVHDWLDDFLKYTNEQEESVRNDTEFDMLFIGIPKAIVATVFRIIDHLNLGLDTKYLTVHLYDKFMSNYFWEVYKKEVATGLHETSWSEVCEKISKRSKLHLASCMQLASKMDSHSKSLGISQVLCILRRIDKKHLYSRDTVISSEFKVFQTVGYEMPLRTPFHSLEILLAMTGLGEMPYVYDICINLLDLSYLQHEQVYFHVQCLAQGHGVRSTRDELQRRNVMALKTNILLLSASIILCASFFLKLEDSMIRGIESRLSELIDIKDTDIWDTASILLVIAIQE